MKIENSNIQFQSKIKFIDAKSFREKVSKLSKKKHYVGYPWTPETMKSGKDLYTDNLMDCIYVGIKDGNECAVFHLCTRNQDYARKTRQKGFSIEKVKRKILDNINLDNQNLHALVLGSYNFRPGADNIKHLRKILKFFDKLQIPYTVAGGRRDVHYFGKYSVLYKNNEDTFYVTNSLTGSDALQWDKSKARPKEIELTDGKIVYNTYRRVQTQTGGSYEYERHKTGLLEFLKSQFTDVSVSKFDELI